jgi:hypothetical protein
MVDIGTLVEPLTSYWSTLDPLTQGALVVGAGAVGGAYLYKEYVKEDRELESTSFSTRKDRTVIDPIETSGGYVQDSLYNKATANTDRFVGVVAKAKSEMSLIADKYDKNDKSFDAKQVGVYGYAVLKGKNRFEAKVKYYAYRLLEELGMDKININYLTDYYYIIDKYIDIEDNGIFISKDTPLMTRDDLTFVATAAGVDPILQKTMMDAHIDYTTTLQQLPEIYSQLNTKTAQMVKMENVKSSNFIDYLKEDKNSSKKNYSD